MHTNRRMDSRLHGNDGKKPPLTWQRKPLALLLPSPPSFCHPRPPSVIPTLLLSFPRKRESIFTW